jgi:peptidoglycan/LPS O-acetylase OafA/YrhL
VSTAPIKPISSDQKVSAEPTHLKIVDGLRGALSLWVLAGHVAFCSGAAIPLLDSAGLAVDIFMFVSGLLMAYHFRIRELREPWESPVTWCKFYVRRFFRIAPAYYFLLLIALLGRGSFHGAYNVVVQAYPPSWISALPPSSSLSPLSWQDVLAHVTFLYGFIPQYASSNALPDWSIGLEMQFYLAFPFIMLLFHRRGYVASVAICLLIWGLSNSLIGVYAGTPPKLIGHFPQPTFLPLKLNCFVVGILVAEAFYFRNRTPAKTSLLLLGALAVSIKGLSWTFQFAVIAASLVIFQVPYATSRLLAAFNSFLSTRAVAFLADTSYGVYLAHNLILLPLAATLIENPNYAKMVPLARFSILLVFTAAIVYPIAFLIYKFIETPGINFGRQALDIIRVRNLDRIGGERRPTVPTPS